MVKWRGGEKGVLGGKYSPVLHRRVAVVLGIEYRPSRPRAAHFTLSPTSGR